MFTFVYAEAIICLLPISACSINISSASCLYLNTLVKADLVGVAASAGCCWTRSSLLVLHPALVIWLIAARRENSQLLSQARPFLLRGLASSKLSSSEIRESGRPVLPTASAQGSFPRKQRPRSGWTSGRGWWT